jgi:chemotaxis protein CheC
MYLTDLQLNAVKEVLTIGAGCAANSLNEMLDTLVSLQIPAMQLLSLDEARQHVAKLGWGRVSSVQMSFSVPLKGNAALVFPHDSAATLVTLLAEDEDDRHDAAGMRIATLEELGNIVLSGVLGSVSNLLKQRISFSQLHRGEGNDFPSRLAGVEVSPRARVIVASTRVGAAKHEFQGEIFLFLESGALETLVAALDRCIELPSSIELTLSA